VLLNKRRPPLLLPRSGGRIAHEDVIRISPFASEEHEEVPRRCFARSIATAISTDRGGGFRGDRDWRFPRAIGDGVVSGRRPSMAASSVAIVARAGRQRRHAPAAAI